MITLEQAVTKYFLDMDIPKEIVEKFVQLIKMLDTWYEDKWNDDSADPQTTKGTCLEDLLQYYYEAWEIIDPLLIQH